MKFTKRMLIIMLTVILLSSTLVFPTSAAAQSVKTGVGFVSSQTLRLREKATTQSRILANANKNEVVILLAKTGDWYKVIYNLQEGYMHADYLTTSTVKNAELGYGQVNYTKVNMRTGPGVSYKAIGQSSQGDMAYIIGLNNGWYKVIWNDSICYIRSDYLTLTTVPYENRANPISPLFFRGGKSTGTPVSVAAFKNSVNYIGASTLGSQIVATAKKYIGVPYLWAGTTPKGFDCSGFTQYVFKQHGISLSRTTLTQYQEGNYVSKANLQPGDLVFFQNTYRAGISHVGIYVGNGNFIHASSSKGVTITPLSNSYWASRYYGARRIF